MSRTFLAITEAPRESAAGPKSAEGRRPALRPAVAPVPTKGTGDDLMDDSSIPFIEVGGAKAAATSIDPPPRVGGSSKVEPRTPPTHVGGSPVVGGSTASRQRELAESEAKRQRELAESEAKRQRELAESEASRQHELAESAPTVEPRLEFEPRPVRLLNVTFQAMPAFEPHGYGARIGADVVTYHQPNHPVAVQYNQLQHQIALQLPKADRALIVLTSARGGAGTSTAALNIAISRALDQKGRVLLVDSHPGQPTLASRIGCADQPGLSELLAQSSPVGLALQPTDLPNLHLLAWGKAEKHLGDAAWAKLPTVVARLMQRFEWIIVDAPHHIEGLKRWIALTDGIYMVVRQDEWDSPQVDQAHEVIRGMGGKIRGCLMTAA